MDESFSVIKYHVQDFMKTHKVCTRDGRSIRILCTDLEDSKPIVAALKISRNCETILHCYANGRLTTNRKSDFDIVFKQINN